MVKEAETFREEDEAVARNVTTRNALEQVTQLISCNRGLVEE